MLKIFYLKISAFDGVPDHAFLPEVSFQTREWVKTCKNAATIRRKLLGEVVVKRLLMQNWGLEPEKYQIVKGEHGKPYVISEKSGVYYNLSHSGDYLVCALSEKEVGVDIEKKGKIHLEVAQRFFHPEEFRNLQSYTDEQQRDLFYRYWSVKESFLKYTGKGLSASLSGFLVCFTPTGVRLYGERTEQKVYIRECLIDDAYCCYVCSETTELPCIYPLGVIPSKKSKRPESSGPFDLIF